MKKLNKFFSTFLVILFLCSSSNVFAQVGADPNTTFYEDAVRWELLGLTNSLPLLRPYPLQVVRSVLEDVINSTNLKEAERASEYYEYYFSKSLRFGTSVSTNISVDDDSNFNKQLDINLLAYGNVEAFENKLTASFEAAPMVTNVNKGDEILPAFTSPNYDYESDTMGIGSFNIFTPFNAMAAYGTSDVYFQAGLTRSSWGALFQNSMVIDPEAPHSGLVNFTINKKTWKYDLSLLMLSASNSLGQGSYPSKYFYSHSFSISPISWFDFTIYESCITGPRFDFTYLLPIVPYMAIQQIVGYANDNLLLGAQFNFNLAKGLRLTLNGYLDDTSFSDLSKLRFDTRIRMGLQGGVHYTPIDEGFCDFITLNFTMITPYMYTHSQYDNNDDIISENGANYQNYSNSNVCLGSAMFPNSANIHFQFNLNPIKRLKVGIVSSLVVGANVNEGLPFEAIREYLLTTNNFRTDGTMFDTPDAGNGQFDYALSHFMYLTQPTKYYCLQNTIKGEYILNMKKAGNITFNLAWTLQYEKNKGVYSNMFNKMTTTERDAYNALSADSVAQENYLQTLMAERLSDWNSQLSNLLTNYFTVSVKYVY